MARDFKSVSKEAALDLVLFYIFITDLEEGTHLFNSSDDTKLGKVADTLENWIRI